MTDGMPERDIVLQVARTALRTKLHTQLADQVRGARAGTAAGCWPELTRRHSLA